MVEGERAWYHLLCFLIFSVCKFIIPYLKAKFKTFYLFRACRAFLPEQRLIFQPD